MTGRFSGRYLVKNPNSVTVAAMKRRDFSRGLAATTLTGTALGVPIVPPAFANDEKGNTDQRGRDELDPLGRIQLATLGLTVILQAFAILNTSAGFLGFSLKNPVRQIVFNRSGSDKIPFVGRFFNQPMSVRLTGAELIGFLVLVGSILLVIPFVNKRRTVKKVVIVHKNIAYEPPRAPRPVKLSNIPQLGDLMKMPRVGDAYQKDDEMIVLVRPTAIDDDF